jgi:hypothetical protein
MTDERRVDTLVKVLRDWEGATVRAVERGCDAVRAVEVLALLRLILRHWDGGSEEPLSTTTVWVCTACGEERTECRCPGGNGR